MLKYTTEVLHSLLSLETLNGRKRGNIMRAVVFNNIKNFCEFEKDYIRKGKLTHGDQMVHLNSLN